MKIRSLLGSFGLLVLVVIIFRLFYSVLELAGTMDTISDGMIVKGGMVAYANEDYEATPGPCPYSGTCTPVLRDENVSFIHVTGSLDPYLSWASVGWCLPCTCPEYDVQNVVGVAVAQVQYTPTPLPTGSPSPTPEYHHIYKHGQDRDYWREPGDPGELCRPFALATAIREGTQLIPKAITGTTAITGRTAYLSGNPDGCPVYRSDRQTPCAKGYFYIFDVSYTVTLNEEGGLDLTYTVFPQPTFTPTPQPCHPPFVHDVEITVQDIYGHRAYSTTTVTLGGWTDTWAWDGHFTVGDVDWSQSDILTIQFSGFVAGFVAEYYGYEPPECVTCAQRDVSFGKEICYGCVDIDVHRPQVPRNENGIGYYRADFDPEIVEEVVPEDQEESPGAGIRYSGNDRSENSLQVDLSIGTSSLSYSLCKTSDHLRVYSDEARQELLMDENTSTMVIPYTPNPRTVWLECTGDLLPDAEVSIKAWHEPGVTLFQDKVHLYRFQSAIIIIGGETQHPAPYEEGNYGIFRMGTRVYNTGWNVYMYNEDGGPTAYVDGEIYDEIVTFIQDNRISNLAIAGYSHGGGSTYDISNLLNENREEITRMFYLQLTAYIDAVSQPYAGVETRWPPSSHSHSNFYQDNDWTLHGGPTEYPGYGTRYDNCHVNCLNQGCCGYGWGDLLGHTTIDDAQQVLNRIETLVPTQLVTK